MPSFRFQNTKQKTLLALFAPPRAAPASANIFPTQQVSSSSSSSSSSSPSPSPSVSNSSPCAPLIHIPFDPSTSSLISSNPSPYLIAKGSVALVDDSDRIVTRNSSPSHSDVDTLLDIFLEMPYLDDINVRTRTLDTLCTLCSSTPGAADRCVAVGGVGIILDTLYSIAQPRRQQPLPSSIVEESEKALLLLHLITVSSKAGCAAALQQSSSIIATLGKKLLRISEACNDFTIAVLCTICRHSEAAVFRKRVSESAIPSKLVVVLQVASKDSTKHRVGRLLRLLREQQQQ